MKSFEGSKDFGSEAEKEVQDGVTSSLDLIERELKEIKLGEKIPSDVQKLIDKVQKQIGSSIDHGFDMSEQQRRFQSITGKEIRY